ERPRRRWFRVQQNQRSVSELRGFARRTAARFRKSDRTQLLVPDHSVLAGAAWVSVLRQCWRESGSVESGSARLPHQSQILRVARFMRGRAEERNNIAGKQFDLCVIGGGATGSACALDAQLRGLRTVLVEAGDFAGATSSASTKIIHGGVRYLEEAI